MGLLVVLDEVFQTKQPAFRAFRQTLMQHATSRGPVLVTGASGFIGSAIAHALGRAGYEVRALLRRSSPRGNLSDQVCEIVEGDVRDRSSVAAALQGVRYVLHAAADYRLWAPAADDMMVTNVEGTRIVMEEALRAGVERVVYTSSVATVALSRDGSPADESRTIAPQAAIGAYKRSKVLAERVVETLVEKNDLPAVIVNPSAPVGPRDIKPTPTGRMVLEAASGRMPAFVDTGLNLVHVDDIAAGHLAALERGRVGERYIFGGENVLLRRMLADIAEHLGRRPPRLQVPLALMFPVAWGAEAVARMTGGIPLVTCDSLQMARHRMFFTDAKARRELGYASRPYREGIVDAIAWFRQAGYLK
jgi:dihydroflavonol-4-reductase